jgi:hypothetical protein
MHRASLCLFDAPFSLILVDTHGMLLIMNSGKRPARDKKTRATAA